jgi:hypothetical protein
MEWKGKLLDSAFAIVFSNPTLGHFLMILPGIEVIKSIKSPEAPK